jgi:hypothetical protein
VPDFADQLVLRDRLAGSPQQHEKEFVRLRLDRNDAIADAQFALAFVERDGPEIPAPRLIR